MTEGSAAQGGRRERKRRQTEQRIAEAGIRLFLEHGFDATTLDDIAEAADIARRTFFHYFDSKEAILATIERGAEEDLRVALAAQPADLSPFEAVAAAMEAVASRYGTEEALALGRLWQSTEALRARKQANYVGQERRLVAALCAQWPDTHLRHRLELVAMVAVGALRLAAEAWLREDGRRTLREHLAEIFTMLRSDVTR